MTQNLTRIIERIESKKTDYARYNFSPGEDLALKSFFDIAQELDSMHDLCCLCVAVPKSFFGLDARLYMINPRDSGYMLVTSSDNEASGVPPPQMPEADFAYSGRSSMVLKVRGKPELLEQLPFKCNGDAIGLLEVLPVEKLNPHQELFFVKYANRVGFNVHNRILVEKNIEHLRFIRTLVADIEHNIIAPNIVYRLYIRNLEAAIGRGSLAERSLAESLAHCPEDEREKFREALEELSEAHAALRREAGEIGTHHKNMSLFLESLLRRSHFDQGRLTLRKKKCNMLKDVVKPQLERYAERFAAQGISMDYQSSGIPEEEVIGVVDVGLMAQVYTNLFSNALKYTETVETRLGRLKYVSYGHDVIIGCFGPERDGIKYNVFSTGPHVPEHERPHVFDDQYRGSNVGLRPGSGHGLSFIKNVVEIHGGTVGYEPTEFGNNFYFILPKENAG